MKNRITGRLLISIELAAVLLIVVIAFATVSYFPNRQVEPVVDFSATVEPASPSANLPPPVVVTSAVEPPIANTLASTDSTDLPENSGATPEDLQNWGIGIRESLAGRRQSEDMRNATLIAASLQSAYGPFISSLRARVVSEDDINALSSEMGAVAFAFHQQYMSIYAEEGLSDHLMEVDRDFPSALNAVLKETLSDEQISDFEDYTLQRAQEVIVQELRENGLSLVGVALMGSRYMENFVVAESHVVGGPSISTLLEMQKRLVALEQAYQNGALSEKDSVAANAYFENLAEGIQTLDDFMTQRARWLRSQEEAAARACGIGGTCGDGM